MCGIAGMIDLAGQREVSQDILRRMAAAIIHRGPDEEGFFRRPGIGFASRRLSIVGLADGQQPIYNEDRTIATVFNGEFFDYPERRADLESMGHRFATHCDTELIPHMWEQYGFDMFEHLQGQFGLAMFDESQNRILLARDPWGICPLYYARRDNWLLFGSEIKSFLASGMVDPKLDPRGLDCLFNFFALPGPATCFEGIEALLPGHFLQIDLQDGSTPARVTDRTFYELDFPDRGEELAGGSMSNGHIDILADGLEERLHAAVERRLRADVPVVSYLSGGIDSSMIVAMARKIRGASLPTFTIQIKEPSLDETKPAGVVSRHVGVEPVVVPVGDDEVIANYQRLIVAAESPVVDTSCTAMLLLAEQVHEHGYKAAIMGEGSDEWLCGYSWHRVQRFLNGFDAIPGLRLSMSMRSLLSRFITGNKEHFKYMRRCIDSAGGLNAFHEVYSLMSAARFRFFAPELLAELDDYDPYAAMSPNLDRVRRWHPLHKAAYWGGRIHLPGNNLSLKADRVGMHSSVENRFPFLDREVFEYLAPIHPQWKLRGFREKYILRHLGQRWLPKEIAWARKGMFRAPLDSFFLDHAPPYVEELLSEESLRKTGYFNVEQVRHWKDRVRKLFKGGYRRTAFELGLVGVVATQLWHHTFVDASLADLPDWRHHAPGLSGVA